MLLSANIGPPPPLVLDGIRYQQDFPADVDDPHGARLGAYDEATGERLWVVLVHATPPEPGAPGELPWYFGAIASVPGRPALRLEVQFGPHFVLDLGTRTLEKTWEPPRAPAPAPVADDGLAEFLGLKPVDPR